MSDLALHLILIGGSAVFIALNIGGMYLIWLEYRDIGRYTPKRKRDQEAE